MKRFWMIVLTMFLLSSPLAAYAEQAGGSTGSAVESDEDTVKTPYAFSDAFGEYVEMPISGDTRVVVFGSDEASFLVTSVLVLRNQRALLVDTKFTKTDARRIMNYLRASGDTLTQIFVSHGDPDYYFGLEEIKAANPRIIARTTPGTANRITRTILSKLSTWAGVLGDEIPQNVVLPQVFTGTNFDFEGLDIRIFGSDPARITLYIPALDMLLGGANITSGSHLFLADMSTRQDRSRWMNNLIELRNLDAGTVIPGHSELSKERFGRQSIDFSIAYLEAINEELPGARNSGELIAAMERRYPNLLGRDTLALSARVLTGEMVWEEEDDGSREPSPSGGGSSSGCNAGAAGVALVLGMFHALTGPRLFSEKQR